VRKRCDPRVWCVMVVIVFEPLIRRQGASGGDTDATATTQQPGPNHPVRMHGGHSVLPTQSPRSRANRLTANGHYSGSDLQWCRVGLALGARPPGNSEARGFAGRSHDPLWVASPTKHYILCLRWRAGEAVDGGAPGPDNCWGNHPVLLQRRRRKTPDGSVPTAPDQAYPIPNPGLCGRLASHRSRTVSGGNRRARGDTAPTSKTHTAYFSLSNRT
jgi:hypothetical protein